MRTSGEILKEFGIVIYNFASIGDYEKVKAAMRESDMEKATEFLKFLEKNNMIDKVSGSPEQLYSTFIKRNFKPEVKVVAQSRKVPYEGSVIWKTFWEVIVALLITAFIALKIKGII